MDPEIPSQNFSPTGGISSPAAKEEKPVKLTTTRGQKLFIDIDLAEGSSVFLNLSKLDDAGQIKSMRGRFFFNASGRTAFSIFKQKIEKHWQMILLVLALVVYLASRFIGLDQFPIYFFCDEAIQTNLAANLVHNGFKDETGEFLPTYLADAGQYEMGPSVYIQVIPYLIFGKSIWVTRGVAVVFTLFAAIALALISRNIFKSKYPFLVVLILCITPVWFLHSRTAFETSLAVSFYAAFLYCYMMYRQGELKYVYASLVFGVLSFYSYSPAQLVVGITFLGLLFSDLKYHWKNRKLLLKVFGFATILAIPYIRFLILHPDENYHQMLILSSYWLDNTSLGHKLGIYFGNYFQLLNPAYWFAPNHEGIIRHIMKDYGQFLWWSAPLVALGLVLTCLRLRRSENRLLLISLLAAPTGSALVGPGITRALFIVVPIVLFAAIALDQIIAWLARIRVRQALMVAACVVGMIGICGYMVYDVCVNAPTWYDNYTLSGMQYGGRQLYAELKEYVKENPDKKIMVSSEWANDPETIAHFYFTDPLPFNFGSIQMWVNQKLSLDKNQIFVVIPSELEAAKASNKFKPFQILKTIPYPNGKPGFYFIKAEYVDNIDQIFSQEELERHSLVTGEATLQDGTPITIDYPHLDMGEISAIFDDYPDSLIRTESSNPLLLTIKFDKPYTVSSVTLRVGGAATTAQMRADPADGSAPLSVEKKVGVSSERRDMTLTLDHAVQVNEILISVKNTDDKEPAHVHLWEVTVNAN